MQFLGSAIYSLYFGPLAKYPGPLFAKISSWPNYYHTLGGDHHIWLWRCHQIYGICSPPEIWKLFSPDTDESAQAQCIVIVLMES